MINIAEISLKKKKKTVPDGYTKILIDTHKQNVDFNSNIFAEDRDGLFKHYITECETWVMCTNIKSKQHSMQW